MQTYLLCLWPVCQQEERKACLKGLIQEYGFTLLREENRSYCYERFWELIAYIYRGEKWAASRQGCGVLRKSLWCYQEGSPVTFYLVQAHGDRAQDLLALKEEFRTRSGGHKHSLHTVENPQEAQEVWQRYAAQDRDWPAGHPKRWYLLKLWMQARIWFKKRLHLVEE